MAHDLNIFALKVSRILRGLELAGEVFQKERMWVATSAVIAKKMDPGRVIELMKSELERALLGDGLLPESVRAFLEEYAAARMLDQPPEAARHFAKRKLLGLTPSFPLKRAAP